MENMHTDVRVYIWAECSILRGWVLCFTEAQIIYFVRENFLNITEILELTLIVFGCNCGLFVIC